MLKISPINGTYVIECDSSGVYHELVAKITGSFAGLALVSIMRQGSSTWEQLNSYPVDVSVLTSGVILGSVQQIQIVLSGTSGTGSAEITINSREYGIPDSIARTRAYVQSIARQYATGVSLVSAGRPRLNYVSVQNRDSQAIYFWHGLVPTDLTQTTYLPLDPALWSTGQKTAAATFIQTYGEKLAQDGILQPNVAQTGPLYSCVPTGTAIAHVKVG